MAEILIELVDWKKLELARTIGRIVGLCREVRPAVEDFSWALFGKRVREAVAQEISPVEMAGDRFHVIYSGPRNITVPVMERDRVVYLQTDPKLSFLDERHFWPIQGTPYDTPELYPDLEEVVRRAQRELGFEFTASPPTLVFPKSEYARNRSSWSFRIP